MQNLGNIIERLDGSFVINDGMYHVPDTAEFAALYTEVSAYAKANPDKVTKEIPPSPKPVAEALDHARAAIRDRRRQAEYGGFLFDGQRWDSEEKDELRLNSMITMMDKTGITEFSDWKINADTCITLTPELAARAAAALMGHYAACFRVETAKKAELDAFAALFGGEATADAIQSWLDANLDIGWPGDDDKC